MLRRQYEENLIIYTPNYIILVCYPVKFLNLILILNFPFDF